MKIQMKVLALSCALMAVAYTAKAEDQAVSELAVTEHDEAALPQDIFEELRSLPDTQVEDGAVSSVDENLFARGRHGNGGRHGGGGGQWRHRDGGRGNGIRFGRDHGRSHRHPGFGHHNRRDRDHNRHWRGYPRYAPVPVPYPFAQVCFAKNRASGRVFRASGFGSRWAVQDEAVRACRRNSARPRFCRPIGCR